jgi:hypothetical protein
MVARIIDIRERQRACPTFPKSSTFIKQAGDSLRQQADARPHAHDAEHSSHQIASPTATNVMCPPQGREQ